MTAARVTAACVLGLAALLFVAGAAAEHDGRANASASPDERLASRVERAIGSDSRLTAARIDADASSGVVTLRGSVPSSARRSDALRVAGSVSGVRAVHDELQVGAPQDRTEPARF